MHSDVARYHSCKFHTPLSRVCISHGTLQYEFSAIDPSRCFTGLQQNMLPKADINLREGKTYWYIKFSWVPRFLLSWMCPAQYSSRHFAICGSREMQDPSYSCLYGIDCELPVGREHHTGSMRMEMKKVSSTKVSSIRMRHLAKDATKNIAWLKLN